MKTASYLPVCLVYDFFQRYLTFFPFSLSPVVWEALRVLGHFNLGSGLAAGLFYIVEKERVQPPAYWSLISFGCY